MSKTHASQSVDNNLHLRRYLNIVARQKQHRWQPTNHGALSRTTGAGTDELLLAAGQCWPWWAELKLNADDRTDAITASAAAMSQYCFVYLTGAENNGRAVPVMSAKKLTPFQVVVKRLPPRACKQKSTVNKSNDSYENLKSSEVSNISISLIDDNQQARKLSRDNNNSIVASSDYRKV